MRAVERHASHVMLTAVAGSTEQMLRLMAAASAVIRAGGLGVHVENVGIAHPPQQWLKFDSDGINGAFRAFVVTVDAAVKGAYSCGMNCFGMKEVSVPIRTTDCLEAVGTVAWHLLVKGAPIRDGQTLSIGAKAAPYSVCGVKTVVDLDGLQFYSQIGTWQLDPRV